MLFYISLMWLSESLIYSPDLCLSVHRQRSSPGCGMCTQIPSHTPTYPSSSSSNTHQAPLVLTILIQWVELPWRSRGDSEGHSSLQKLTCRWSGLSCQKIGERQQLSSLQAHIYLWSYEVSFEDDGRILALKCQTSGSILSIKVKAQ